MHGRLKCLYDLIILRLSLPASRQSDTIISLNMHSKLPCSIHLHFNFSVWTLVGPKLSNFVQFQKSAVHCEVTAIISRTATESAEIH